MKCAAHPSVETGLRCGKCDKAICPKCMVMTPVGARCRECAGLKRLPTYNVPAIYYLRAAGVGFGTGVVVGFIWYFAALIVSAFLFGLFPVIAAAGAGYVVATSISMAVNKKRGRGLALIGGGSVIVSWVTHLLLLGSSPWLVLLLAGWGGIYQLFGLALGIFVAVSQLK